MTNKEAIEIISRYEVNGCGYCHQGGDEVQEAFDMAINALKAKEPRLMTFNEVFDNKVIEYKYDGADDGSYGPGIVIEEHPLNAIVDVYNYGFLDKKTTCVEFCRGSVESEDTIFMPVNKYGKTWRCWTSEPSEEQRKAAEWQ